MRDPKLPRNLLDLDDVIIRRIGYFLHEDNEIPLPLLHSHWMNFKTHIKPGIGRSYRRLEINIPQTAKLSSQSFFSKWLILVEFLSKLTSLEELIIIDLPFCQHDQLNEITKRHNKLHLPRRTSLSLQQTCRLCSTEWISPFLLACPNFLGLKAVCREGTEILLDSTVIA
uniref:Uncharacterized protein n=1 Tax=Kwoniella bestiolae CBS 10118 TaxID=1296100 RepID=A0A1B9FW85_9TREE|nr:hypothetical protein I302_07370 [Kwoniella bestiolae CBS 10118]OCF23020.1 hypothetical protein I302_07370 [Kwoniella bestiolae CBS 10118]